MFFVAVGCIVAIGHHMKHVMVGRRTSLGLTVSIMHCGKVKAIKISPDHEYMTMHMVKFNFFGTLLDVHKIDVNVIII